MSLDNAVFTFLSYRQYTEPYSELISTKNTSTVADGNVDIESIKEMLKLYCNPGMIGDQYTSFATNDPAFWPIRTYRHTLLVSMCRRACA